MRASDAQSLFIDGVINSVLEDDPVAALRTPGDLGQPPDVAEALAWGERLADIERLHLSRLAREIQEHAVFDLLACLTALRSRKRISTPAS